MDGDQKQEPAQSRVAETVRNLLVIPIIVGIVVALVTFFIPRWFADETELSYTLEGPINYLADPALGHVSISINGVESKALVSYRARVWNSGDLVIRDVGVRFEFTPRSDDFTLFSASRSPTRPKNEFPEVKEERPDSKSVRYEYRYLNPGNEDAITFLTNQSAKLAFFSNPAGTKIRRVEPTSEDSASLAYTPLAAIIGLLSSILAGLLSTANTVIRKRPSDGRRNPRRRPPGRRPASR